MKVVINVGGQKCGTTYLDSVVRQLGIARTTLGTKELHYFDSDKEPAYQSYFPDSGPEVLFEATPSYLHLPGVAEKIADYFPANSVKIIVLHRDPVKRAMSQYLMNISRGIEKHDNFEDAFTHSLSLDKDFSYYKNFGYLERGLYHANSSRYVELFGEENVHFYAQNKLSDSDFLGSFLSVVFESEVAIPDDFSVARENKGGKIDNPLLASFYKVPVVRDLARKSLGDRVSHRLKKIFSSPIKNNTTADTLDLLSKKYFNDDYSKFKREFLNES
jgi:hypothetical protein